MFTEILFPHLRRSKPSAALVGGSSNSLGQKRSGDSGLIGTVSTEITTIQSLLIHDSPPATGPVGGACAWAPTETENHIPGIKYRHGRQGDLLYEIAGGSFSRAVKKCPHKSSARKSMLSARSVPSQNQKSLSKNQGGNVKGTHLMKYIRDLS